MKTFRMFGMALVAAVIAFAFSACEKDGKDAYKDYPQLIVGKWFNINPDMSMFVDYNTDGTFSQLGYTNKKEWRDRSGRYEINGNKIIGEFLGDVNKTNITILDLTNEKFIFEIEESKESTIYRVKESFDIKGNYTYLNSAVRIVAAEGKTALQLPEGVLFNGENYIPVDAMHGDRIIDVMKKFFADATFAADGKLNHTLEGETKVKNYTLNGNNLVFNLYEGSDTYKVNATSFPDEYGDRLFIIIPKQAAWLGGMVDLVEKENEGLTLNAAQIAALEKEFMETFETFTVILSLSKK